MIYKLIADLENTSGNIDSGFVSQIENGGWVFGKVCDELGNELSHHWSTTLSWLESDLLESVKFDSNKDTYTKNW